MSVDYAVTVLALGLGMPVLGYHYGHQQGQAQAQQTCPAVQHGERLAHATQNLDGSLVCAYITHTEGKVKKLKAVRSS